MNSIEVNTLDNLLDIVDYIKNDMNGLYTHKNNVIPIKELQNSISKTKEPKPTTVYCIISNIRKLIKNHGNNYNIIKIGDGYKLQ